MVQLMTVEDEIDKDPPRNIKGEISYHATW